MKLNSKIKRITIISSIISLSLIIFILGIVIFQASYSRFKKDAEVIRQEYYNEQKKLIKDEIYGVYDYIEYHKSKTKDRIQKEIKSRVYEAYNIANNIYINKKDKSDKEIEENIKNVLRQIRFNDGSGYYFAYRLDGTKVLYADDPKTEGNNLLNFKDEEGRYVIKDMIEIVSEDGEGFYEYKWTKPNEVENNYKKISFVKYFEPLDIFIGTGLYISDLEEIVKKEVLDRISKIRYQNNGYIFVTTYDGTALVFAQQEYLGKDISYIKDINGLNIHSEELKVINSDGEGYINYIWPKPNSKGVYPKLTYVKGIDDWKWIIGTGVYIDEIENTIGIKESNLKKDIFSTIIKMSVLLFGIGFIVLVIELHLLKRAAQAVKEDEKVYEILTDLSEDGIFILGPHGKILELNKKGLEILNYSVDEIKNINFENLIKNDLFKKSIVETNIETFLINKDTEIIPIELHIKHVEINRKDRFIAYVRDLTKRKIYEDTLKELAITDELTDVYNRRFILNQLNSELLNIRKTASLTSLVMFDIDKFKIINDTYGHVFGDEVLKTLTKTFRDNLRKIDFIGRYGGEEFIVILPKTEIDSALAIVSRIKDIFTSIEWEHKNLKITFSAGIFEINNLNSNETVTHYINEADKLLYKAKQNGRDRIEI